MFPVIPALRSQLGLFHASKGFHHAEKISTGPGRAAFLPGAPKDLQKPSYGLPSLKVQKKAKRVNTHLNMKENQDKTFYNPQHTEKSSDKILIVGKKHQNLIPLALSVWVCIDRRGEKREEMVDIVPTNGLGLTLRHPCMIRGWKMNIEESSDQRFRPAEKLCYFVDQMQVQITKLHFCITLSDCIPAEDDGTPCEIRLLPLILLKDL